MASGAFSTVFLVALGGAVAACGVAPAPSPTPGVPMVPSGDAIAGPRHTGGTAPQSSVVRDRADPSTSAEAIAILGLQPPAIDTPQGEVNTAEATAKPEQARECPEAVAGLAPSTAFEGTDPRLHAPALLVADKAARRLMLFEGGALAGCWAIGLGFDPSGHKLVEGDGRTPEGWYRTSDKPWSSFEGAIAISYPNVDDAKAGLQGGRLSRSAYRAVVQAQSANKMPPQRTTLGGAVLIHGGGSSRDWTLGCMALDDADLVELRERMPTGQRADLLIVPGAL